MQKVFFDGNFIDENVTPLNGISAAAFYGKGVFTTVAVFSGEPFLWEKHWRRLTNNAESIGIDISRFNAADVHAQIIEMLNHNSLVNGRVRITFFDAAAPDIWKEDADAKTSLLINAAAFREVPSEIKLTVSPYRLNTSSPLVGVKSCNYLENIIAINNAKKQGFNEAVRLNERGEVTGGCMSNIFWTKNEKLYTPALSIGCLPGTTREFIIEKIDCSEVVADVDELNNADSVFLTSAGFGVIPVNIFNDRTLKAADYAILDLLPGLA